MLRNFVSSRIAILVALVFFFQLTACGGGGGGNNSENGNDEDGTIPNKEEIQAFIKVNTDPIDPMLSEVTFVDFDDRFVLFGSKDNDGNPTKFDLVHHFLPGSYLPIAYQLDDFLRPTIITFPNIGIARLSYEADNLIVNFEDTAGNLYIETFPLSQDIMDYFDELARFDKEGPTTQPLSNNFTDNSPTIMNIRGKLKITLKAGDYEETIKDAMLKIYCDNKGSQPVIEHFNPQKNDDSYTILISHRLQDLSVLITQCEKLRDAHSKAMGALGVLLCVGAWLFTAGWGAIAFGASGIMVIGGTTAPPLLAATCKELAIKKAISEEWGKYTITLHSYIPNLQEGSSQEKTVTYDLFNENDPVTLNKEFTAKITHEVKGAIMGVWTIPVAPVELEEYQLVFKIIPPSAELKYTLTRNDGYTYSETLIGDGVNKIINGSSIKGGKAGSIDHVIATLSVKGEEVHTLPFQIKFHRKDDPKVRSAYGSYLPWTNPNGNINTTLWLGTCEQTDYLFRPGGYYGTDQMCIKDNIRVIENQVNFQFDEAGGAVSAIGTVILACQPNFECPEEIRKCVTHYRGNYNPRDNTFEGEKECIITPCKIYSFDETQNKCIEGNWDSRVYSGEGYNWHGEIDGVYIKGYTGEKSYLTQDFEPWFELEIIDSDSSPPAVAAFQDNNSQQN